ncbi:Pimeloyl-ACP methyl ester carboxylesterase [Nannocystis exedens]|uniref:Pimeloyl-ACP methyl ester carboxylesterase n=1 Tax=Nannocystis exedens TaxID=54 RepID=A0A1I2ISJ6_9BACT|nr:alpha/beta fold hydrolase [Nannocystis exedens]PCC67221.1 Haloacetate dehalogenase H-1 [Nannocystis exedens]SFF45402.1 Pimeloyl-ACP methyl ester carboxylesterase [Nannocystis exedens]
MRTAQDAELDFVSLRPRYVERDGVAIEYSVSGEGAPLLLVFGFGMSQEDWAALGYVGLLARHFQAIAVSPRGHGRSSKPHEASDYSLAAIAGDLVAVLDALAVPRAVVWGYSLGAKFALALAAQAPERVAGLVLGGFETASEVNLEDDIVTHTLRRGGAAWRELWDRMAAFPAPMLARLEACDTAALLALREAEAGWGSFESIVDGLRVSGLLYAAEHCFARQSVVAASRRIAGARYLERAAADHFSLIPDAGWIVDEVVATFGSSARPKPLDPSR